MEKSLGLIDSIIDLQLEKITPDEWLTRLAHLGGATAANAISWIPDELAKNNNYASDDNNIFPVECIKLAEDIISRSPINGSPFLDDAARSLGDCTGAQYAPFYNTDLMIACLDREPSRTLIVLSGCKNPEGWAAIDRSRFAATLPTLRKSHELHRKLTYAGNNLDIANQVLNSIPRGVIAMQPDGKIFKANRMALDILARHEGVSTDDGYLRIAYPELHKEFKTQLHKCRLLTLDLVNDFSWKRGYVDKNSGQFYQLALSCHPMEDWHLESSAHDRWPVLTISMPNLAPRPSASQLGEFYGLTAAQSRVIACMLRGNDVNDTGAELHISVNTIRSHLRAVYDKLGVSNKSELMRLLSMTLVDYK